MGAGFVSFDESDSSCAVLWLTDEVVLSWDDEACTALQLGDEALRAADALNGDCLRLSDQLGAVLGGVGVDGELELVRSGIAGLVGHSEGELVVGVDGEQRRLERADGQYEVALAHLDSARIVGQVGVAQNAAALSGDLSLRHRTARQQHAEAQQRSGQQRGLEGSHDDE